MQTYEYSEKFQRRIAALCLQDISFLRDYYDVIDPKYFDFDYLSSIVRVCTGLVEKHNELPSSAVLIEEMKDFCTKYKIGRDEQREIIDKIEELYGLPVRDTEAIKNRVIRFGKRQALKLAVLEVADLVDKDSEFDRAIEIVGGALAVGENANKLGMQLFGNFSKLPKIANESSTYGKKVKIPTNLKTLDNCVWGGPGCGEVWVLMGLPGSGKSQTLVNFGAAAINRGFPVAHVTIGDLDEVDVSIRYAARLSGYSMSEVITETDRYMRRAKKLDALMDRYLRVKFYPSSTATPATVRAYLQKLWIVDDIRPKMLIIDYPDEFRPYTDNDYQNMGRIYSELMAIAAEFGCLTWVASQVRRWRPEKDGDVIMMDNIADSWKKAAKADGIVSITKTYEEHKRQRARIWIDKVRRGHSQELVRVAIDWSMCYLRQLTEEEAEEEESEND